jgi:hypothetical protein
MATMAQHSSNTSERLAYLTARALPLGIGIVVMPICARLYPPEAWTSLSLMIASVGLTSAVGASLRPLTVRNAHITERLDRLLNGKLGFALMAAGVGAVLAGSSIEADWMVVASTASLSFVGFMAGDTELIMAARLPAKSFRARVVTASCAGNGLQVLLGWISPTTASLLLCALVKSLAGFSVVVSAFSVRRIGTDMREFARDAFANRVSVGSAAFTSGSRAAMYWVQVATLTHLGLETLVVAMYLAGRYIEPLASTLSAALTDMTLRALGQQGAEVRPLSVISSTFISRIAGSLAVITASGALACFPDVFLGMSGTGGVPSVLAVGGIAASRVFVSPSAWIPHSIGRPSVLWLGEAVRVTLFLGWLAAAMHYRTASVALWGLVGVEAVSYVIFQTLIKVSAARYEEQP